MNRAPVNGPVDDPTCNYNTGSDKPGESVSSSPGQTSAETAEPTFPSYQIPNRHHIRTHRSIQSKRPLSRRFMPVWLHHRANPSPGASVLDYTELVASPTTRRSSRNVADLTHQDDIGVRLNVSPRGLGQMARAGRQHPTPRMQALRAESASVLLPWALTDSRQRADGAPADLVHGC